MARYLRALSSGWDTIPPELESSFVRYANTYSTAMGLSHTAWRAVGVPDHVLKAAGIGPELQR